MRAPTIRAFLLMLGFSTLSLRAETSAQIQFRHMQVVGNELRVLLDTSVFVSRFYSHSSTVRDVQGWLVCVDLSSTSPMMERAKVYGPLWETGARSELSHAGNINFTDRDRKASAEGGFVAFDHEGNVIRIRASEAVPRHRLLIDRNSARWIPEGTYTRPSEPIPAFGTEDMAQNQTHRYTIRRGSDLTSQLYETLTGTRVPDPWLESAFSTYRGMKEMGNVRVWLTDDLNYFFCFPQDVWQRLDPPPRKFISTFEWAGKVYDRKRYAFYFARGNPDPIIIVKPAVADTLQLQAHPVEAFSINGELHLLYQTTTGPTLLQVVSGKTLHLPMPSPVPPARPIYYRYQQVAPSDHVVIFGTKSSNTTIELSQWSYRDRSVTHQTVPLGDLFRESFGKLRPRKIIPLKEP